MYATIDWHLGRYYQGIQGDQCCLARTEQGLGEGSWGKGSAERPLREVPPPNWKSVLVNAITIILLLINVVCLISWFF